MEEAEDVTLGCWNSCFLTHSAKASTWRSPLFVLRLRARMAFYRSSVQCFPKVVGG